MATGGQNHQWFGAGGRCKPLTSSALKIHGFGYFHLLRKEPTERGGGRRVPLPVTLAR